MPIEISHPLSPIPFLPTEGQKLFCVQEIDIPTHGKIFVVDEAYIIYQFEMKEKSTPLRCHFISHNAKQTPEESEGWTVDYDVFRETFCTVKEYRKLKLHKIDEHKLEDDEVGRWFETHNEI